MEVIARDRQEGKTTELIRLAARDWLYIVCINEREAHRVYREAYDAGIEIPHPVTWAEFAAGSYHGRGIKGFVIDNLDLCVQQMTAVPVQAVSLNASPAPAGAPAPGSTPS